MAYNEVTLPAWQGLVRRVFGLQGPGGNVPVLAPEIQPVVMVQPDVPEYEYLRGVKRWAGGRAVSGGAASRPIVSIINPTGSGRLVVVERFTCSMLSIAQTRSVLNVATQTEIEAFGGNVGANTMYCPRDVRI